MAQQQTEDVSEPRYRKYTQANNVGKKGNPICDSCESDRKNSSFNARRGMREDDECWPLYLKVEECGKVSGHRVQACFKEWREFASCKRQWIAKERHIAYNRPQAPEKWLERHPEFRDYVEPIPEVRQQAKSSTNRYAEHYDFHRK